MDTTVRKQITLIKHEPSYKQLEVKTNRTIYNYGVPVTYGTRENNFYLC